MIMGELLNVGCVYNIYHITWISEIDISGDFSQIFLLFHSKRLQNYNVGSVTQNTAKPKPFQWIHTNF